MFVILTDKYEFMYSSGLYIDFTATVNNSQNVLTKTELT